MKDMSRNESIDEEGGLMEGDRQGLLVPPFVECAAAAATEAEI